MRLTGWPCLVFLIIGLVSCGDHGETPFEEARVVRHDPVLGLKPFLSQLAEHFQLPAIAIAVINADGSIDTAIHGQNKAMVGDELPLIARFHLGSCGKSFTALLAAIFVDEGALGWDTTVVDVFPEFREDIGRERSDVTLRALLSHTAGIAAYTSDHDVFGEDSVLARFDGPPVSARRLLALELLKQRPANDPGEFNYSNAGYAIAAAMLERVSGEPYEHLLEARVFEPLGLDSAMVGFAVAQDPGEPWRHHERSESGVGIPLEKGERVYPAVLNPAGNLSMSIKDFASYLAFHMQGLQGNSDVVSTKALETLHGPVVQITDGEQYALGWYVREIAGNTVSTHSGSDQTIFALMSIDHSSGRAVAAVTNIGGQGAEIALVNAVLELMH